MNKKIILGVGIGLLLLIWVVLKGMGVKNENPSVVTNQIQPIQQPDTNIKQSKALILKTYNDPSFSIEYPDYLNQYTDSYFCDVSPSSLCAGPIKYVAFLNSQYSNKSSNNEVNRIDIYNNTDIAKIDLQLSDKKEIVIGKNHFVTGNSTDWLGGKAYWIQGKGYTLRITFRTPKENMAYDGFVDLASLKLK